MSLLPDDLENAAKAVLASCASTGTVVATAESCTGGLIAACLTAIPGSSQWVDRGFVTYSNEAKSDMLGIPMTAISQHGAVSKPVAIAMAEGALARSRADVAVSVTGIAGPGGGTADKPIGTVHMALACRNSKTLHEVHVFTGNRDDVRRQTALRALKLLADIKG